MSSPWTPERRARQAELIRSWRPWASSTGPRTAEGKAAVARNAYRGGQRQQLRALSKQINTEILASRELIKQLAK